LFDKRLVKFKKKKKKKGRERDREMNSTKLGV